MDDDEAATQQTVQSEPVAQEEPTEQVEQPNQEQQTTETPVPQQVEEVPTATEAQQSADEDFDPVAEYANFNQSNYQFVPGEDGTIDPNQVAAEIEQKVLGNVQFNLTERKGWDQIEKKYGEDLTPTRRRMILNARIASTVQEDDKSLTTLADEIMGEFKVAQSAGKAQAGVSTSVQKAASLETASNTTGPSRNDEEAYDRIIEGDNEATTDLISEWMKSGKL